MFSPDSFQFHIFVAFCFEYLQNILQKGLLGMIEMFLGNNQAIEETWIVKHALTQPNK